MNVLRSLLPAERVSAIVAQEYGVRGPIQGQLLAVGDNDTYSVNARGWRAVCRVYARRTQPGFGHAEHRCELDWLLHLAQSGVRVAAPIQRLDGELLGQIEAPEGLRDVVLLDWAEGERDASWSLPGVSQLGQALAELHRASQSYVPSLRRVALDGERLVDSPLSRIGAWLESLRMQLELSRLLELAEPVRRRLGALPRPASAHGFIHGDCNGENHHLLRDGGAVFFDMDLCGPGWFAYDLAISLWAMRRAALPRPALLERAARLLAAYQRVRRLEPWELQALDDLVLARELWVMGEHVTDIPSLGVLRVGPEYWRAAVARFREWQRTPLAPAAEELLTTAPA